MAEDVGTNMRKQLVRGSAAMVIGRGIGLLAGLGVTVLLARLLEPAGYGVYALAQSVVALLAVPAQLGLPTLVIREVALATEQRDWSVLRGILLWSRRAVLAAGIALAAMTYLTAHVWHTSVAPDFPLTLMLALAYLVTSSLAAVLQGVLQGVRQFALALLPDMLFVPALFAVCLLILGVILKVNLSPPRAMALYALCALASLIAVWIFVQRKLPQETWSATPVVRGKVWISAAFPLCLTAALTLVNSQLIIVIIGSLASTRDVGLYRVAASGAAMAIVVGATLGGVSSPYIATLHERRDTIRLGRLASYSAWFGALPAIILLVIYYLAGDKLLTVAFGVKFAPALPALLILTVGQTVSAATGVVQTLLNMTGHGHDTLRGVALGAVTSVILCFALIPGFGVNGAAVASTMGIIAEKVYLVLRVRLRLNIDSSILPRSTA